jgi:hypothetical protein
VSVQDHWEVIDLQNNDPIPIPSFHLPMPILIRQPNNSSFPITLIPSLIVDRCGSKVHLCQFLAHSNIFLSLLLESQWGGGGAIQSVCSVFSSSKERRWATYGTWFCPMTLSANGRRYRGFRRIVLVECIVEYDGQIRGGSPLDKVGIQALGCGIASRVSIRTLAP